MRAPRSLALSIVAFVLAASVLTSCALPSFDKVADGKTDDSHADGGTQGKACGRSDELAPKCDRCIQANCCALAEACGKGTDCGRDLVADITPAAQFSSEFEPLLGCMQENCDEECGVSWGCLEHYDIAAVEDEYDVPVQIVDFAAVPPRPLPDVTTDACRSIDPGCDSGRVARGVSDDAGEVVLSLPAAFDGFFEFSGGGYAPATAQWSEPVYRNAGFPQSLLTEKDVQNLALATGVHESASDAFDPELGHIIFRAHNCLPIAYVHRSAAPHAEASDVQVTIEAADGSSPIFYTDRLGAVAPELEATSSTGIGGAFNFPGRNRTVTAFDARTGRQISKVTAVVRPQTLAFVYLMPNSSE
jgi:hypothetical protein